MWKLSEKPFDAAGKIPSLCNEFFPESSSLFDLTAVIVAHFVCLCFWLLHCPAEKSGHRPLFEFPFPTSNTQLCRSWNSGRKKNIFVRSNQTELSLKEIWVMRLFKESVGERWSWLQNRTCVFHVWPTDNSALCPIWGYNCGWLSSHGALRKHTGLTQF